MEWIASSLFALFALLMSYVLLRALREADQSYASEYTVNTTRQLEDMFLFISPQQMLFISRTVALFVFMLFFFAAGGFQSARALIQGVVIGAIGAAAALLGQRVFIKVLRIRRLERFNHQLVNALNSMSNALKAGFSIQQAFETVVSEGQNPIAQEFGMFLQQLRVGVRFEEALADMDGRIGSEDLTLMTQAIEIARQTGGNLTEVFDRIAETIRERQRIEGKIKALTAQGKIQGRVVGAMPFILAFVLYLMDKEMMLAFFRSTGGIIIVILILVMQFFGALLIRKITNVDV
ncbi:MAG: type II secretion system F family protein [Pontiellaceae bacterium]|nr:type II secretion system F family protein [Pontiellaceae bacterium]